MKKKLRVWWVPQIPCEPFIVPVTSVEEGAKILDVLADYDLFQYRNKIKSDFSNAGGLEEQDPEADEWVSWWDEETGTDDPREYLANKRLK